MSVPEPDSQRSVASDAAQAGAPGGVAGLSRWPHFILALLAVCGSLVDLRGAGVPADATPGIRSWEVRPGPGAKAGFTLLSPASTGVWFTNLLRGDLALTNAVAHNGSGVALGDVDGDGWQD